MKTCSIVRARLAVTVLSVAALPALAQDRLPDVVVSASRTEQRLQDALPATTLITREEIERAQQPDLPTLLRRVAGVEIAQNGGPGSVASAFIRGAESRHTLVLPKKCAPIPILAAVVLAWRPLR